MAKYAASKGVPAPDAAVAASGVLLTLGGLCLIAGKKTKLGGSAVALFLGAVSPVMHNFWAIGGWGPFKDPNFAFLTVRTIFV